MEGQIIHAGHSVFRRMEGNVVIETDAAENIKVTKAKSKEKVDGIVASIMALDRCIRNLARGIKMIGVKDMSFEAFDTRKIDEYAEQAKAFWGKTDAYKEYEQKAAGRSMGEQQAINARLMGIFAEFGKIRNQDPVMKSKLLCKVKPTLC